MIAIIDYGVGNLTSVKNILKKAGADDVQITSDSTVLKDADKFILPGVGHFDYGMQKIESTGLIETLSAEILIKKKPVLGICLGAQLLTEGSAEGDSLGLGWIKGRTVSFDKSVLPSDYKLPHMGWNYVKINHDNSLSKDFAPDARFYFVHTYHLEMDNPSDVWLTTDYGYEFCSAFRNENIYGCQFHPEKSHKFGLKFAENFVNL